MDKKFRSLICLFAVTSTLLSGSCSSGTIADFRNQQVSALSQQSRPLPLNRFMWSRNLQTDAEGFYYQPAGLCDDYPEESADITKIRRDLETLKSAGVKQLRFAFGWDSIEEEGPGEYNWLFWDELVNLAPQYGVTLIPYVGYTPAWLGESEDNYWREPPRDLKRFGHFMNIIATRYKGKIKAWELWNEPDIEAYWLGSADQFAAMVIEGAKQLRKADPGAVIVLGGMSHGRGPFYDALMKKHNLGQYFDVINLHGYNETWIHETTEEYPHRIKSFSSLIPGGRSGPDMWLAEFGYSNYRFSDNQASQWGVDVIYDYEHTPEYQAVTLFKQHIMALAPEKLSLTAWYRINDLKPSEGVIGDDNNKFLGILDINGKKKPSFYALKFYNQLFNQPTRNITGKVKVNYPAKTQSVVNVFEKKDGKVVITGWLRSSLRNEVKDKSGKAKDTRKETLDITLPFAASGVQFFDTRGAKVKTSAVLEKNVLKNVELSGAAVFIAELRK